MRALFIVFLVLAFFLYPIKNLFAIHYDKETDRPWAQNMSHELDKPLNDYYSGNNFFMNLGPTGIRARINEETPKQFNVMFVFQDDKSPAKGLINIGDVIIGANGKVFEAAHGFHRTTDNGRGWVGPPFELAQAIEDSQGTDGKLKLIVLKGGNSNVQETVTIQLKVVGRFTETYPWFCPRTEQLREDLSNFIIDNGIKGREHFQIQQLLALWASKNPRATALIEDMAQKLISQRADPTTSGMVTWGWGYKGIFLGEYYNMTNDNAVLPAIESIVNAYEIGMDYRSGGFSHRPFPFLMQRVADGGSAGYGSMAASGGLSMLAQSMFKELGLPYSEKAYQRTHLGYLQSAGPDRNASFAYGFDAWEHAVIQLSDPSKALSGKGIGYEVPTGMNNIGSFTVFWPTQEDPRWKPTDWIVDEAATNIVIEKENGKRLVIRRKTTQEPTSPYTTGTSGAGHLAPIGMGVLSHIIGNKDNDSWNYLAQHMATCAANSYKFLWDGHAEAIMHSFFGTLGAARANKDDFRKFLQYSKTWIILSETHDGGLVEQPFGCQRNSTCSVDKNRLSYTHVALMLLSLPNENLLLTEGVTVAVDERYIAGINYNNVNTTSSESGANAEVRLVLKTNPGMNVTVQVTSSNSSEGSVDQSVVFTPLDWHVPRSVFIRGVDDDLADGTQSFNINFVSTSNNEYYNNLTHSVTINNTDNEIAGLNINQQNTPMLVEEGGTSDRFYISLNAKPVNSVRVNITNDSQISLNQNTIFFTQENFNQPVAVTLTAVSDEMPEFEKTSLISISVDSNTSGAYSNVEPEVLEASVIDFPVPTQIQINNVITDLTTRHDRNPEVISENDIQTRLVDIYKISTGTLNENQRNVILTYIDDNIHNSEIKTLNEVNSLSILITLVGLFPSDVLKHSKLHTANEHRRAIQILQNIGNKSTLDQLKIKMSVDILGRIMKEQKLLHQVGSPLVLLGEEWRKMNSLIQKFALENAKKFSFTDANKQTFNTLESNFAGLVQLALNPSTMKGSATLISPLSRFKIVVPPEALDGPSVVSITTIPINPYADLDESKILISKLVHIDIYNIIRRSKQKVTNLTKPIYIECNVNMKKFNTNFTGLRYFNEVNEMWAYSGLSDERLDSANDRISVNTTHLTPFAVINAPVDASSSGRSSGGSGGCLFNKNQ